MESDSETIEFIYKIDEIPAEDKKGKAPIVESDSENSDSMDKNDEIPTMVKQDALNFNVPVVDSESGSDSIDNNEILAKTYNDAKERAKKQKMEHLQKSKNKMRELENYYCGEIPTEVKQDAVNFNVLVVDSESGSDSIDTNEILAKTYNDAKERAKKQKMKHLEKSKNKRSKLGNYYCGEIPTEDAVNFNAPVVDSESGSDPIDNDEILAKFAFRRIMMRRSEPKNRKWSILRNRRIIRENSETTIVEKYLLR